MRPGGSPVRSTRYKSRKVRRTGTGHEAAPVGVPKTCDCLTMRLPLGFLRLRESSLPPAGAAQVMPSKVKYFDD